MGKTILFILFANVMGMCKPEPVETAQGVLEGEADDGFTSYRGIPYASVSGRNGRFMPAGLAPSWEGVRRASSCSDARCLQLDVHVPAGSGTRAVLVWLSGGAPGWLARKGIIVVQVFHRNGPFGFLCLGNEKIPGNVGVKDVVMALRWVRDNIAAFRGLPDKVVVAGHGLGAAVVEALMLSPSADGLFQGAIMQSGSLLSQWTFNYDAKARAMELAKYFTKETDLDDVTEALINAKESELIDKARQMEVAYFPFAMCAENPVKKEELLLSDAPIELLTNRRGDGVPLIIGFNSNEGYIFASNLIRAQALERLTKDETILLPEGLIFSDEYEIAHFIKQIKDMYFKANLTLEALLGFHRDAYFISHVYRSARLHAQAAAPVYLYQFSHGGDAGVVVPGLPKTGAALSDELAYLFPDEGRVYEGDDLTVQNIIVQLWSDFVKFLDPSHTSEVHWERLAPHSPRLLDIGSAGAAMQDYPHARAARLWDDLHDQYYYGRQRNLLD